MAESLRCAVALPHCVQVQTTASNREEAGRIADALLRRRLAACVQVIGPVQSRYWWHGELEESEEWLCLAKTTEGRAEELIQAIGEAHSYETPEIIVMAIVDGSEPYLRWVSDEVEEDELRA
ncbi:MAG TPA: divalent-cation tolerance protein CutA [Acidimicrobiales bacterium]|nr:divalent-cation tolerance protein CutA [Acidimicrobiales bacterium]